MPTDSELIRDYASTGSENAFAELVRRHVNLVYSAALREAQGDAEDAEDITQSVFAEAARKASRLFRHPALAGWFYTCVRRVSANARRADQRRRRRELETRAMKELLSPDSAESAWLQIQPVLDDAVHELGETGREAVVLRFSRDCKPLRRGLNLTTPRNSRHLFHLEVFESVAPLSGGDWMFRSDRRQAIPAEDCM